MINMNSNEFNEYELSNAIQSGYITRLIKTMNIYRHAGEKDLVAKYKNMISAERARSLADRHIRLEYINNYKEKNKKAYDDFENASKNYSDYIVFRSR